MKESKVQFLTLAEILAIHQNQIDLYGGKSGVRDFSLLSSAIALPEATFNGKFLHQDIFIMAASYAFHICQNHPFVDGNKRVGLASALVFLEFNGIEIQDPKGILYNAMMNIAKGEKGKNYLAHILKKLAK